MSNPKSNDTGLAPTPEPALPRKPGRPRSAEADRAILVATLDLLAEVGLQALSIEQVAARAGVGKKTVYRRWSSKNDLVCDAIRTMQAELPLIDTGNLRHDLMVMHRTALASLAAAPIMRPLYLRLASELHANPPVFQAFLTELVQPRFEQFKAVVRRAQERGEVSSDLDLDLVVDMLIGPMLFRWVSIDALRPAPSSADATSLAEHTVDLALSCLGSRGEPV